VTESNKKNSSVLSYKKVSYDKEINRYTESVFIAESEGNICTIVPAILRILFKKGSEYVSECASSRFMTKQNTY
jgi:hypothetical protein